MHGSLSFLGWWTYDCRVWDTTFEGNERLMILAACCRHQLHACFGEFGGKCLVMKICRSFSEDFLYLTKYSVFVSNLLHSVTDGGAFHMRSIVTTHSIEHHIELNDLCGQPWLFVSYPEQVL